MPNVALPPVWRSPSLSWTVICFYTVEATRLWTASIWTLSRMNSWSHTSDSPGTLSCTWWRFSVRCLQSDVPPLVALMVKPPDETNCMLCVKALCRRTQRSRAISPEVQVLAALGFYTSGSFQTSMGDTIGISQASMSRCLSHVTKALVEKAPQFITFNTYGATERRLQPARVFVVFSILCYESGNLPH